MRGIPVDDKVPKKSAIVTENRSIQPGDTRFVLRKAGLPNVRYRLIPVAMLTWKLAGNLKAWYHWALDQCKKGRIYE